MAVTKSLFGKSPEGKEISLYTLSNSKGMKAAVTDLGATLVRVLVPDAAGKADDLAAGIRQAGELVDTGKALAKLEEMVAYSRHGGLLH